MRHRGARWPRMIRNATETPHLEHLGGLGSAVCCHTSGRPWVRNPANRYRNYSIGVSGWLWVRNGAEIINDDTKTDHLEHLGDLGPMVQNGAETKHLGFKRHPPKDSGFKRDSWLEFANLALRKGWLEDASERDPALQPTLPSLGRRIWPLGGVG